MICNACFPCNDIGMLSLQRFREHPDGMQKLHLLLSPTMFYIITHAFSVIIDYGCLEDHKRYESDIHCVSSFGIPNGIVILPNSIVVDGAICVELGTLPVSFAICKLSFILATICPVVNTIAVLEAILEEQ